MKKCKKVLSILIPLLLIVSLSVSWSSQRFVPPGEVLADTQADRTLSPFFVITSDNSEIEQFPLESTSADVDITGVIADVAVTQIYRNTGKFPIEAMYVFPASTRAAVYSMKMVIGERIVQAKIMKRDEARKKYEKARQEGKSASLLEQQRPNVFQMNVVNIMPGDLVKVEMKYTELLVPENKMYEFVYPTVVGPRYSNQAADSPEDGWVRNPYTYEGEPVEYDLDISLNIDAGMPLHKLNSTTHRIDVQFDGKTSASVALDNSEKEGGNRDFILRYALAGKAVETGLLMYRGEKEKFFLLMMQPPERVMPSHIPGREYVFILDVSGSMNGFPLDITKELMRDLIGELRPEDRFNVLLFAGASSLMAEQSVPATEANVRKAISFIDSQRGGGGTEILPAVGRALALPEYENYSRTIVIATDGYVHVEDRVFDTIRNNLGRANLFAFGIGSSVNRHIIEGMAHAGMGEPFVVTHPEKAAKQAERFRKMIQTPVLTNIHLDFGELDVYDVEPRSIPDVLSERPVIVFGKWRGQPEGTLTMHGINGREEWTERVRVHKSRFPGNGFALQYLWARHRVKTLSDYIKLSPADERIQEVTNLGLTYNLLTDYTSFIAVDSEVRNKKGYSAKILQPLPLPDGVSNYAAGTMRMKKQSTYSSKRVKGRAPKYVVPELAEVMHDVGENGAAGTSFQWEKERGRINIEKMVLSKGITEDDIRRLLEKHMKEIHACYETSAYPEKIKVRLLINPSGSVKEVNFVRRGLKGVTIEKCLGPELRKWRFSKIAGKGTAAVIFTLVFK